MKVTYAKNPAELALITNPQNPKGNGMKKTTSKTNKRRKQSRKNPSALGTAKDLLVPAAGILGGQIAASQATSLVDGMIPESLGIVKKFAPAALPIVIGGALLMFSKNPIVKSVGIGMGASGIAAGVRAAVPSLGGYMPISEAPVSSAWDTQQFFIADSMAPAPLPPAAENDSEFIAGYDEESDYLDDTEEDVVFM